MLVKKASAVCLEGGRWTAKLQVALFGPFTHTQMQRLTVIFSFWTAKTNLHAADSGNLSFVLHMREKIFKAPCVLFLSHLLTSLSFCAEKFGTPITDDVSKLSLLKQNIPLDYEIAVQYIPREVAGACWVVLNVYPLEQSLRNLAEMFGAISSNKDNILVFIAMLKSLRFTFDHEKLETSMQVFQCHYQEERLKSGLYFHYIEDLLHAAREETSSFSCKPPSCLNTQQTPGGHMEGRGYKWWKRTPLLLLCIPVTACVALVVWRVTYPRHLPVCHAENIQLAAPCGVIPSMSVSIPLRTDTSSLPEENAIPGMPVAEE